MGYAPVAIVTSVVVEGCVLAVVGAIFGLLVVFVALDGLDASMIGASFMTVDYDMQLTMKDVVLSLMVALVIGSLGSIIPAGKAVKI
jgi:putative ABC transport system permease protein